MLTAEPRLAILISERRKKERLRTSSKTPKHLHDIYINVFLNDVAACSKRNLL